MPPTKRGTRLKRQRQSRPLSSTETAQNPGKTAVSSLLRHRDRTLRKAGRRENSTAVGRSAGFAHGTRGNDSLVPSQTPRPHKTSEKQQSRPFSDTETTQNLGKTAVSSHLKHRDRTKPRKNSSLVPSQAPRPHKSPEKQQSRPFSSTETTQNPGKAAVSSLLRHRDRTKPRKNSSLVPSQAPRQHKTPEKQQSRPISSTETVQNPGKTAVSSHPKHRDHTNPQKSSSLVPFQAPRPHKIPEKQQSRPFSGTETAQNPGKTAVSSLLKHRDSIKPRKNSSLVPSPAPRPHKTPEKQQSRPISNTETAHYGR